MERAMMNSIQHETELPVAEILHRVANCFQLLTSTVHLRLKQTSDPVAGDELAWVLEVIRTVSLLQRHLTSHRGQNFEDYLQELVKYWQPLLEFRSIRIEADTEPVELGSNISSALALIVQELLTNSVKHAFNGAGGVVHIGLKCCGSEAELTIGDNGQGVPERRPCSPGTGMTIMRRLSEQIGAAMKVDSCESGTVARLRFPVGAAVKSTTNCTAESNPHVTADLPPRMEGARS
jgi:two-component sensor histidine kinase